MALFQSTAIEKYITAQDQKVLKDKWEAYKVHLHDPNIQENIRNAEFLKKLKKKKIKLSLF
jgi:ribosomal protein S10